MFWARTDSPSPFVQADLCDWEKTTELLTDAKAIIHMGAIPGPRSDEPRKIFENNVQEHV